ncbi:MAG: hypothetical protein Unbinned4614contig1000_8 [Prokaryotic dsDNA virus sp.]|nr:MAG: hypothetical protein Unbinned4614contig1000_8 [Prokaryotic dsDNA virus sp.]|tara:strand:- start:5102 stop:10765 length:5664 start_codon:yes stop_codon:yes gene_type:complete
MTTDPNNIDPQQGSPVVVSPSMQLYNDWHQADDEERMSIIEKTGMSHLSLPEIEDAISLLPRFEEPEFINSLMHGGMPGHNRGVVAQVNEQQIEWAASAEDANVEEWYLGAPFKKVWHDIKVMSSDIRQSYEELVVDASIALSKGFNDLSEWAPSLGQQDRLVGFSMMSRGLTSIKDEEIAEIERLRDLRGSLTADEWVTYTKKTGENLGSLSHSDAVHLDLEKQSRYLNAVLDNHDDIWSPLKSATNWTVMIGGEMAKFWGATLLAGPVGTWGYLSASAHSMARDHYEETGDYQGAVLRGTLFLGVTGSLLKYVHGTSKKLVQSMANIRKGATPKWDEALKVVIGYEKRSRMKLLKSMVKDFGKTVGVFVSAREAEFIANSMHNALRVESESARLNHGLHLTMTELAAQYIQGGETTAELWQEGKVWHEQPVFTDIKKLGETGLHAIEEVAVIKVPALLLSKGTWARAESVDVIRTKNAVYEGMHGMRKFNKLCSEGTLAEMQAARATMVEGRTHLMNSMIKILDYKIEQRQIAEGALGPLRPKPEKVDLKSIAEPLTNAKGEVPEATWFKEMESFNNWQNNALADIRLNPGDIVPGTKTNRQLAKDDLDNSITTVEKNSKAKESKLEKAETEKGKAKEEGEFVDLLRDDPLIEIYEAIHDVSGRKIEALKKEYEALKDAGELSQAQTQRKRFLEEALETHKIAMQGTPAGDTEARSFALDLKKPDGSFLTVKKAIEIMSSKSRSSETKSLKESIKKQVQELVPELKGLEGAELTRGVNKVLKASEKLPTKKETADLAKTDKKSFSKAIDHRGRANREAQNRRTIREAVKKATDLGRSFLAGAKEVDLKGAALKEHIGNQWKDFKKQVKGLLRDPAHKSIRDDLVTLFRKRPTTHKQLMTAIRNVKDAVEIKQGDLARNNIQENLATRTEKPETHMPKILDDVVTGLQNLIAGKPSEWRSAIDRYYDALIGKFQDKGKEAEILKKKEEFVEIIEKLENNSGLLDKLSFEEAIQLESLTSQLLQQNHNNHFIRRANAEARAAIAEHKVWREMSENLMGTRHVEHSPYAGMFTDAVKFMGYGLKYHGRLGDVVEFLSGGNNTFAHQVLSEDIVRAVSDARLAESNLSRLYTDTLKDIAGLSYRQAGRFTDANRTYYNTKHAFEVKLPGFDQPIYISRGQAVRLLEILQDPHAWENFEQGAGLRIESIPGTWNQHRPGGRVSDRAGKGDIMQFRGDGKYMTNLVNTIVDAILATPNGQVAQKIANANVQYYNSAQFRQYQANLMMHHHGVEGLVQDVWVPIKRVPFKEQKAPKTTEADLKPDIGFTWEVSVPFNASPRFNLGGLKFRSEAGKTDIRLSDANSHLNTVTRELCVNTYIEPAVTLAKGILQGKRLDTGVENLPPGEFTQLRRDYNQVMDQKSGRQNVAGELVTTLTKHFYDPIVQYETGRGRVAKKPSDNVLYQGRNMVLKSGLSYQPTVPVYQALSSIAAGVQLGVEYKTEMLTALATLNPFEYRRIVNEMTSNSGWGYERFYNSKASNIASGEYAQISGDYFQVGYQSRWSGINMSDPTIMSVGGAAGDLVRRGVDVGMGPISFVDHVTVATIYKASKNIAIKECAARGIEPGTPKSDAIIKEHTRRKFERCLLETQPTFHPATAAAYINMGAFGNSFLTYAYSMYQGYTSKLNSIVRRSFMRADRSFREGDSAAGIKHILYGQALTAIGSSLIPLIRETVKQEVAIGTIKLGVETGLFNEEAENAINREFYDWGEYLMLGINQTAGSSMLTGELVPLASHKLGLLPAGKGGHRMGTMSPVFDTVMQGQNAIETAFGTHRDVGPFEEFRRMGTLSRSIGAITLGLPIAPVTAAKDALNMLDKHNDRVNNMEFDATLKFY